MLVKVFEAENMNAALKMVKETLGPEALILSTRTVRRGGLGLLGKPLLEVTAAAEPQPAAQQGAAEATASPSPGAATAARPAVGALGASVSLGTEGEEISYQDIWKRRRVIDPLEEEIGELKKKLAANDLSSVREEIDELKDLVRRMVGSRPEPAPLPTLRVLANEDGDGLALLQSGLTRLGIIGEAAETILRLGREKLNEEQLQKPSLVDRFFRQVIAYLSRNNGPLGAGGSGQKRVALIGPTGVGKTTTIAKLAAERLLRTRGKVALVTIDTYRIAAVEQLKVYGEIMNLPVEVVVSPLQLREAFVKHADKELILIDTAGRSPKDDSRLEELTGFLGPEAGIENHLVLAASTRDRELQDTVRRFRRLPLHSLIFTKVDECASCGALVNIPLQQKLPVSYITNGQRVPEDLLLAEPASVAACVMGQR